MPEPRRSIPAPNQPWPEGDRWGWVCPLSCPSYGTSPSRDAARQTLAAHLDRGHALDLEPEPTQPPLARTLWQDGDRWAWACPYRCGSSGDAPDRAAAGSGLAQHLQHRHPTIWRPTAMAGDSPSEREARQVVLPAPGDRIGVVLIDSLGDALTQPEPITFAELCEVLIDHEPTGTGAVPPWSGPPEEFRADVADATLALADAIWARLTDGDRG